MSPAAGSGQEAQGGMLGAASPAARVVAAVVLVLAIVLLRSWASLLLALALALVLAVLDRRPLSAVTHRLLHVEGFLIMLLALLPFTVPGATIFTLGPLSASAEGFHRALVIALKVNAAALVVLALITGLEPVRLGQGLAQLGLPSVLTQLLLLTVRYVGVFREEAHRLQEAMRARGFKAGSNLHTWRTLGNLAGQMLVRALDRAERVEEAMRLRGFSGRLPEHETQPFSTRDRLLVTAALGIGLLLLGVSWLG